MLDPEVPPAAEGEVDGGADGALRIKERPLVVVTASNTAASTPPRWIIVTERAWAAIITIIRGREAADAPALNHRIRRWSRSRCLRVKTPHRAYLLSWTTCSSRRRFRRPHAN